MCIRAYVCVRRREGREREWELNGLIRDVQVQPSHFECMSKNEEKKTKKKTSYCAGLLLRAANTHRHARAHTRTQPPCMTTLHAGTTGWLKTDTDDFFCDLSALLPQTKKEKGSYVHTQQQKKLFSESGHQTLFHKEKKVNTHKVLWGLLTHRSKKQNKHTKKQPNIWFVSQTWSYV